ncbi:MAG: hypothetical protein AB7K09_23660, partial [Planctomycetota bacterium]
NPRPVPVLVGGGRRTDPFDMAGSAGPHHDEDDATAERSPGDAARRASSRLGTRASHYLDNVQDKFAPVVAIDEAAEIEALADGPRHLPNLVRNLKRTLATLPPYGGLTLAWLESQPTIIEDRFSANTFRTQSYDLAQLARLLIETTVNSLARTPRRVWDEDGERTYTLPGPLGMIHEVILTWPPLMAAPVRRALRQWFRDGGVVPGASREWDEVSARVLHACLGYLHERGGKVETFIRRFGTECSFIVVDAGATGTRLARVKLTLDMGAKGDDDANGNGKNKTADAASRGGFRPVTLKVTHEAVCESRAFTGEHLLLSVFRLLKLKLAALIAGKLATLSGNAHATARASAKELLAAIQQGKVARMLQEPTDSLPPAVERLLPTRFRDRLDETPRRHFTLLTLLAARVLETLGDGRERTASWSLQSPGVSGAVPTLQPLLLDVLRQSWPHANFTEADIETLSISAAEVSTQMRPAINALGRAVRSLQQLPVVEIDPDDDAHAGDKVIDQPIVGAALGPAVRSPFARGWSGPAAAAPSMSAAMLPLGSTGTTKKSDGGDDDAGESDAAPAAPAAEAWLLFGGGGLVPRFLREMLINDLTLRDDSGAGHEAPKLWPDPTTHEADAATAIALGACEAERAVQAGLNIDVIDAMDRLQFDIGIRTDRFIPLFTRGTSVRRASSVVVPSQPGFPLMVWYRYLDGVEAPAPLGSFDTAPAGDGALTMSLAPRADGGWTLELTRGTPFSTTDPGRTPSVSLIPAPPLTPLELNLYSGIH